MAIPRENPLKRWASAAGRVALPARGIPAEKQVEGGAVPSHTLGEHTGGPADIGAAKDTHSHPPHNCMDAMVAPTVNDDETAGFSAGSRWTDVVGKKEYVCVDATAGAAIWRDVTHHAISDDDVTIPPTDAELDSAFGTPANAGDGFIGILDDNGAGTTVYLCVAKNGAWWYEALTKAT